MVGHGQSEGDVAVERMRVAERAQLFQLVPFTLFLSHHFLGFCNAASLAPAYPLPPSLPPPLSLSLYSSLFLFSCLLFLRFSVLEPEKECDEGLVGRGEGGKGEGG
jgi:hypothetical protein